MANDGTVGIRDIAAPPGLPRRLPISLTWNSETFLQNQNANAIRLALCINFRFDATARRRLRMRRSASSR